MNPRGTPQRILATQASNQLPCLKIDARTAAVWPGSPPPIGPKPFAVPAQARFGPDDDKSGPPAGPDLGKDDPEHPVPPGELDPTLAEPSLQERRLVTKGKVLSLQGCPGAEQVTKRTENLLDHRPEGFPQVRPTTKVGVRIRFSGGTGGRGPGAPPLRQQAVFAAVWTG